MIKDTDIFGYFMLKSHSGWSAGCPKCKQESLVNFNYNDKIACVDPKCNWEWNRYND